MIEIFHGEAGARRAAGPETTIIVVDALRASATLAALFESGAKAVRVCSNPQSMEAARKKYPEHIVVGEWQNEVPPEFDYDNSPLTILNQNLTDKEILFLSTNGARMLVASSGAKATVVGSLVNATAVASYVNDVCGHAGIIGIVPAGDNEQECDEDSASAAVIAEAIGPYVHPQREPFFLGWLAEIADRGIERLFLESAHGKELKERGREQDVKFCCQADILQAVPKVERREQVDGFEICVLVSAATSRGC